MRGRSLIVIAPLLGLLMFGTAAAQDCTAAGPVSVGDCKPSPPASPANQPASQTESPSASERKFFSLINSERTSRGLRPLQQNGTLQKIARDHAARMARDGRIYHNYSGLQSSSTHRRLGYPEMLGENVGVGPSTKWLHNEFMGSARHRANILDSRYTHMGIGVVVSDGSIWVVEDFMRERQAIVKTKPRRGSGGGVGIVRSRGGTGGTAVDLPAIAPQTLPAPEIVTAGPQLAVSSLQLPPLPAPGPGMMAPPAKKAPSAMPLAMLAMLSATALVTRKGGTGWI